MTRLGLAVFGWVVPGGAYLLTRRYAQAAAFACVVCTAVIAGLWLQGSLQWPEHANLQGLDPFTSCVFQGSALVKALAGLPYAAATLLGPQRDFLTGRVHEFGTTLLLFAGVVNAVAISSALDQESE